MRDVREKKGEERFAALIKTKQHCSIWTAVPHAAESTGATVVCLLPCTGTQDGIRRNYHTPREDISRPWPVPWWNCTRNQHIFHTKSKQQLHLVAVLNHQPVRLTARPRTWLKKPNDHLALHALWWLAQKCAQEEVLASHFTSPNSSLVKQPTLLRIRSPSVWFSLRVWALRNSRRGNESHVADGPKDTRWLHLWPVMEMSNNAPQWKPKKTQKTLVYLMKTIFYFPLHY